MSSSTDVYSLGCVICTCLSGEPPFAHARRMQQLWAQLTEMPPDPCLGIADAPIGLGSAVLRGLIKDPLRRSDNAREYVGSLYAAAGIEPGSGA